MRNYTILMVLPIILSACTLVPPGSSGSKNTAVAKISRQNSGWTDPESRQCLARLGKSGSQFAKLPDHFANHGCNMQNPVQLKNLGGDRSDIGISNIGATTCTTATAFADWARYGVDRAAHKYLGSGVERIETMGSYVCRTVAGSKRLSAHGRAEAVDVVAFILHDGRRISVLGDWDRGSAREKQFLRAVQQSACKRFGTVLGPEYNRAHRDHFHLEKGGETGFCR